MNQKYANLALLILRVGLGVAFLYNGWQALHHTEEMVQMVEKIGFPLFESTTLLTLVGISDTTIGLLLVLGLWTEKIAVLASLWLLVVFSVLVKTDGVGAVLDELPYLTISLSLILLGSSGWNTNRHHS